MGTRLSFPGEVGDCSRGVAPFCRDPWHSPGGPGVLETGACRTGHHTAWRVSGNQYWACPGQTQGGAFCKGMRHQQGPSQLRGASARAGGVWGLSRALRQPVAPENPPRCLQPWLRGARISPLSPLGGGFMGGGLAFIIPATPAPALLHPVQSWRGADGQQQGSGSPASDCSQVGCNH